MARSEPDDATVWECPRCERRFGRPRQGHVCAPAMSVDDYFARRDPIDRAIFEAVADALADCGAVEIEAVSVGILVKHGRTFVELRPRKRGMTLAIALERRLDSPRVTRHTSMGARGWSNGVPIIDPSEVDDEIRGWLVEAFDLAADARR